MVKESNIKELRRMLRISEASDEDVEGIVPGEGEDFPPEDDLPPEEGGEDLPPEDDLPPEEEEEVNPWNEATFAPTTGKFICYSAGKLVIADYDEEEETWKGADGEELEVSHWMEVPPPPEGLEPEEEGEPAEGESDEELPPDEEDEPEEGSDEEDLPDEEDEPEDDDEEG